MTEKKRRGGFVPLFEMTDKAKKILEFANKKKENKDNKDNKDNKNNNDILTLL